MATGTLLHAPLLHSGRHLGEPHFDGQTLGLTVPAVRLTWS